jgi:hypothetical protein
MESTTGSRSVSLGWKLKGNIFWVIARNTAVLTVLYFYFAVTSECVRA